MNVQTYYNQTKTDHHHISVYPQAYPLPNRAGKIVAANNDSTSHVVLDELPASAVYCGSYVVRDIYGRPL